MTIQADPKPLPFFFIGKEITDARINSYINHKHSVLSDGLGKPDTKSIWYSREHIAKLLEEIDNAGGDGIRIAFGMYEPSHEFAGQLCLVMNATREKRVGNQVVHTIVVLENETNFESRSTQPKQSLFGQQAPFFEEGERDFNYGSPCPPRCDGGDDDLG